MGSKINYFHGSISLCPKGSNSPGFSTRLYNKRTRRLKRIGIAGCFKSYCIYDAVKTIFYSPIQGTRGRNIPYCNDINKCIAGRFECGHIIP